MNLEVTNIEADLIKEALLELSKSRYQMPNNMMEWRKKAEFILSVYDKVEKALGVDKAQPF
jgi:hypothetical protein